MKKQDRRDFIRVAGTFAGGWFLVPRFLKALPASLDEQAQSHDPVLVVVQLSGGNDGLNTYIPYQDPAYHSLRGRLAISADEVLKAGNGMAWHPAMTGLWKLQQEGLLSVVQNTGYQNPVRSHFRSMEIWQTGSASGEYLQEGWLGRFLDKQYADEEMLAALNVDSTGDSLALKGKEIHYISMQDPERYERMLKGLQQPGEEHEHVHPNLEFVRQIATGSFDGADEIKQALAQTKNGTDTFPKSRLGRNLYWISRMIKGGLKSRVYYTSISGFDTHINQLNTHQMKLKEVSDAIYAFYQDLKEARETDRVTMLVFSEFGRRIAPNGTGTDHGKAAPVFVIGGKNKGLVQGHNPDLLKSDEGDLRFETDFRQVYEAVLSRTFGNRAKGLGLPDGRSLGLF